MGWLKEYSQDWGYSSVIEFLHRVNKALQLFHSISEKKTKHTKQNKRKFSYSYVECIIHHYMTTLLYIRQATVIFYIPPGKANANFGL